MEQNLKMDQNPKVHKKSHKIDFSKNYFCYVPIYLETFCTLA